MLNELRGKKIHDSTK